MYLYELYRSGVTIDRMKNKQGKVYGLKFTYGEHSFKASEIGREFGYRTLPKQFESDNAQNLIILSSHSSMRSTNDSTPTAQVASPRCGRCFRHRGKFSFGDRRGHSPTDTRRRLCRDRMATEIEEPIREKEEAREGDMSLYAHLVVHPDLSQAKKNRIKNTCHSKGHRNIAPSNDKRPLFVQILATPSASLVSTSLPVQCLRPTNFFFCRGIFPNSFLRHQNLIKRHWISLA